MAAHEKYVDRAERIARHDLAEIGRELRLARLNHDLSQTVAGTAAGISHAAWSRLERGEAHGASTIDIARAAAVVGLDVRMRAFPGGRVLRDVAHVELLVRLRAHIASGARWATEVPLPDPGDKRAWDALIRLGRVLVGVEAETRARDSQELQRRVTAKLRDGGVDHVVLLLARTRHNRTFLRAAGASFLDAFPVDGSVALKRLQAGTDPGGNAIILL